MNQKVPIGLRVDGPTGEGLRVEFAWTDDRYAHQIFHIRSGVERALVRSCEGQAKEAWPPSPPIQQVRTHDTDPGHQVLLGLGMAGSSHWSLSVEAINDPPTLLFDVACRVKGAFPWLGSSYGILPADHASPMGAAQIVGCAVEGLEGVRMACQTRTTEHPVELVARSEPSEFSICVRPQPADSLQRTLRWQYHVVVVKGSR